MEISLRDEKGQAVVEYVLVLVVAVSIILGGIYQLNSAFKTWANNYFGNYLACLLETGELPTISGTGGDSGLCNQFFKPFTLADGRPLVQPGQFAGGDGGGGESDGGGTREVRSGGNASAGGGGYGGSNGRFDSISGRGGNGAGKGNGKGRDDKMSGVYTGDTSAANYSGYSSRSSQSSAGLRTRLDNRFAFDESREKETRRSVASSSKKPTPEERKIAGRAGLNGKSGKKDGGPDAEDSGFSFADLLRYFIIFGILIAIFVFLGGQGLQIGKSME